MSKTKPGLLDVDLPVVGLAVDGGDVLLGLVAGAVLDAELERARDDDVGAGRRADATARTPSRGRAPTGSGSAASGPAASRSTSSLVFFSICFFRNRWNSAWRSTFWSRLSRALVRLRDDEERGERDLLVAAQRKPRLQGELQPDLATTPAREGAAGGEERNAEGGRAGGGAAPRLRATGGLPGRARVGRVELGEARVVAPDVVCRSGRARAPSCTPRAPARTRRSPRARRRGCCARARCFGSCAIACSNRNDGLAPEPLARDLGAEGDLRGRLVRLRVAGAAGRRRANAARTKAMGRVHNVLRSPGGYYRKASRRGFLPSRRGR